MSAPNFAPASGLPSAAKPFTAGIGQGTCGQAVCGAPLDLATLELFDAGGGRGNAANRRFCCPLCGIEKPRDAAHRCLCLDTRGLWHCKRCGAKGKLRDFWEKRDGHAGNGLTGASAERQAACGAPWRRAGAQQKRAELSRLRTSAQRDDDPQAISPAQASGATTASGFTGDDTANGLTGASAERQAACGAPWRQHWRGAAPLAGTPGAAYLSGRGIPLDVALLAGVRFSSHWMKSEKWRGCAAAIFPICDRAGEVIAAQGRRVEPTAKGTPNALTSGPKSRGVFVAPAEVGGRVWHPFDGPGPGVILCEAPLDALSLAACGFPALALCGVNGEATSGPAWLPLVCGLKSVFLAFDADAAGDGAARALAGRLSVYGARCEVLRPEGAKDWNEALQARGSDALGDWIAARVLT